MVSDTLSEFREKALALFFVTAIVVIDKLENNEVARAVFGIALLLLGLAFATLVWPGWPAA